MIDTCQSFDKGSWFRCSSIQMKGCTGYFDFTLYKDIHLGIKSSMATPDIGWFAICLPLCKLIYIPVGVVLEVSFSCYPGVAMV